MMVWEVFRRICKNSKPPRTTTRPELKGNATMIQGYVEVHNSRLIITIKALINEGCRIVHVLDDIDVESEKTGWSLIIYDRPNTTL